MRAQARVALATFGLILAISSGCARQSIAEESVVIVPCTQVPGELAAGAVADSLIGTFRLTLIATSGVRAGHAASGLLTLRTVTGTGLAMNAPQGTRFPLMGSAVVALDSVGAIAPGDIASTRVAGPGVLGIQSPTGITLRLGSESNTADAVRFDGAFMTLTIASIDHVRFGGTWTSGSRARQSAGYFCADRTR